MQTKTFIQLGRSGDILNVLPFLRQDALKGERHALMVASEFAPLLDGVSYVEPVIYEGPYHEIDKAAVKAEGLGRPWLCTQVNGPTELVREYTYAPAGQETARCSSYQKESWKVAGRLKEWDRCWPLIFDRRDKAREKLLLGQVLGKPKKHPKPIILLATGGTSSPFKHRELLHELLNGKYGKSHRIVDISAVRAHRLYDLLALYERAYCLVATDSAPLHLARAVPTLPVIALANDQPILWNGSSWEPNHVFYCRYGDFPERARELLQVIEWPVMLEPPPEPRVVHVWNAYDGDLYPTVPSPWMETPVWRGACGRDSVNLLKDEKRYPFLKDSLRMGMQRARDCDYVCLSRPGLHFAGNINEAVMGHEACYAYRQAVSQEERTHYPIVDLFCAKKAFWSFILDQIPDFVLGPDYFWSHGLWAIFASLRAVSIHNVVTREAKK